MWLSSQISTTRTSLRTLQATPTYSHTHVHGTPVHECVTAHIHSRTQVFTQRTHLPAHVQARASMCAHIGWRSYLFAHTILRTHMCARINAHIALRKHEFTHAMACACIIMCISCCMQLFTHETVRARTYPHAQTSIPCVIHAHI